MKFSNRKRLVMQKRMYQFILLLFVMVFMVVNITPILHQKLVILEYSILASLFLLLIYVLISHEYFEYDSTGKVLCIKNGNFLLQEYRPETIIAIEFPKEKLDHYKISNYFILKYLNIYIKSSHHHGLAKNKFNITFLSRKRTKALKQSLDHIMTSNQDNA